METWLYTFAAKEIQKYILAGNKLKDMLGGSELINQLCSDFLENSLKGLGISSDNYTVITEAAGWARLIFTNEDDAGKLYEVWPLLVDRYAPGLQVVQSLVKVDKSITDAIDESEAQLRVERNFIQVSLPEVGPLIERNPRNGIAAVKFVKDADPELQDRQTVRKRQFISAKTTLIEKLSGIAEGTSEKIKWPDEMDYIAGADGQYLAVVHADGNDLGKIIIQLQDFVRDKPDHVLRIFKKFSEAIESATEKAAQTAYKNVLEPDFEERKKASKDWSKVYIAARPIVLGGDDITIILRSDLALEFTEVFLETFEDSSKQALGEFHDNFGIPGLPQKLTACAGIAFVKKSYPFSSAYDLAESLCFYSKKVAKERKVQGYVPSSFSFHRVTGSIAGDYEDIKRSELMSKARVSDSTIKLWQGPAPSRTSSTAPTRWSSSSRCGGTACPPCSRAGSTGSSSRASPTGWAIPTTQAAACATGRARWRAPVRWSCSPREVPRRPPGRAG